MYVYTYNFKIQWDYSGHIGTSNLSTVERMSTLHDQKLKCNSTIRKSNFGALESILCREVLYMVSFIHRILNRGSTVHLKLIIFHCEHGTVCS